MHRMCRDDRNRFQLLSAERRTQVCRPHSGSIHALAKRYDCARDGALLLLLQGDPRLYRSAGRHRTPFEVTWLYHCRLRAAIFLNHLPS